MFCSIDIDETELFEHLDSACICLCSVSETEAVYRFAYLSDRIEVDCGEI